MPGPNGKSWLITGGCGFIGTALIRRLLHDNPDACIRVLDNLSVGTREDLRTVAPFTELDATDLARPPAGLEFVEGDIRDRATCVSALRGCDIVVHLAASTGVPQSVDHPRRDLEVNVVGTFNLLRASTEQKPQAFVFASSGAPLGTADPPLHEELAPHPLSPYGASKLAGEGYCSAFAGSFGLPTVALRFGNVYGPGSTKKTSVVAKFIRQSLSGAVCEIFGDGTQTRDFIYVEDLVSAVLLAAVKAPAGEVFQIATGKEHTVAEVAELLRLSLASRGIELKLLQASPRIGDVQRNYSDTSKAREVLGWQARTALADGLERTVDFFLDKAP